MRLVGITNSPLVCHAKGDLLLVIPNSPLVCHGKRDLLFVIPNSPPVCHSKRDLSYQKGHLCVMLKETCCHTKWSTCVSC